MCFRKATMDEKYLIKRLYIIWTIAGVLFLLGFLVTEHFLTSIHPSTEIDIGAAANVQVANGRAFKDSIDVMGKVERRREITRNILQALAPQVYQYDGYKIQIHELNALPDGSLEVFVSATTRGNQPVGFSKDGSVEIERIIFKSPKYAVEDIKGDIIETFSGPTATTTVRYRVDFAERMKYEIADTIRIIGKDGTNIVPGKRGNTTTVYSDAESTNDGGIGRRVNAGGSNSADWSDNQSTADGDLVDNTSTFLGVYIGVGWRYNTTFRYLIDRIGVCYDTSDLSGETVDSATLSQYVFTGEVPENDINTGTDLIYVVEFNPASDTSFVVGDYDVIGDSVAAPTYLSNGIDIGSISTSAYNDFVLTASGESEINTSGTTCLGMRSGDDITAEPTGVRTNGHGNRVVFTSSENTGNSPKLTIEHSTASGGAAGEEWVNIF